MREKTFSLMACCSMARLPVRCSLAQVLRLDWLNDMVDKRLASVSDFVSALRWQDPAVKPSSRCFSPNACIRSGAAMPIIVSGPESDAAQSVLSQAG